MVDKKKDHYQMVVKSDLNELQRVEKFTEQISAILKFSEEDRDSIAISITELVCNAISHGNKLDKNKEVTIDYKISPKSLIISVQDEGDGFNLENIANPLDPENLLKESGRGIYIVRSLMDKVEVKKNTKGTLVKITKKTTKV